MSLTLTVKKKKCRSLTNNHTNFNSDFPFSMGHASSHKQRKLEAAVVRHAAPPHCMKSLYINFITNSMVQSPPWKYNSCSASHEICHLVWNTKADYHNHRSLHSNPQFKKTPRPQATWVKFVFLTSVYLHILTFHHYILWYWQLQQLHSMGRMDNSGCSNVS